MKRNRYIKEIFLVAAGGFLGALLRHGTNQLVPLLAGDSFLITATFIENITGSFLIGFLFILIRKRYDKSRNLSLFALTGVVGSYTTYSGFMVEALVLFQQSALLFFTYLFSQILIGLIAIWAGLTAGKKVY
jgi:fluoride exporter